MRLSEAGLVLSSSTGNDGQSRALLIYPALHQLHDAQSAAAAAAGTTATAEDGDKRNTMTLQTLADCSIAHTAQSFKHRCKQVAPYYYHDTGST